MQTRTKLLDDLSKVLTNAVGVAQGAKTEADNAVRGLLDKWLSDREFVTREEFDVFKAIAIKTREENEVLRLEIEKLKHKKNKKTKDVKS